MRTHVHRHTILDPFLLRRLKSDVLTFLPPKREYLILAPLTEKQMTYNKAIADRTLSSVITHASLCLYFVCVCVCVCVIYS